MDERSMDESSSSAVPKYELAIEARQSPGRGQGCFATRKIAQYTLFLVDQPLISFPHNEGIVSLTTRIAALPSKDKATFAALTAVDPEFVDRGNVISNELRSLGLSDAKIVECLHNAAVFRANAFTTKARSIDSNSELFADTEHDSTATRSIFPSVARINHSCAPNAHLYYRESWGGMAAYALRDIDPGEEIFISYFAITALRSRRQDAAASWGFKCDCDVCKPGPACDEHEDLLVRIQVAEKLGKQTIELTQRALRDGLDSTAAELSAQTSIMKLEAVISAIREKPHLVPVLPAMYAMLALLNTMAPRDPELSHAVECHAEALRYSIAITGPDSPDSVQKRRTLEETRRLGEQLKALDASEP